MVSDRMDRANRANHRMGTPAPGIALAAAFGCWLWWPLGVASEPKQAVIITLDQRGEPAVQELDPARLHSGAPLAGLVVWRELAGRERWQVFWPRGQWPPEPEPQPPTPLPGQLAESASRGGGTGAAYGMVAATVQLEQFSADTLIRGAQLLTPPNNAELLSGQVTFRRRSEHPDKPVFPASAAVLSEGDSGAELLRFTFRQGVTVHGLGTGSFFGPFRAEKCACPLPAGARWKARIASEGNSLFFLRLRFRLPLRRESSGLGMGRALVTVHGLGTGSFFGPFRAEKCACPLPAHYCGLSLSVSTRPRVSSSSGRRKPRSTSSPRS